MGSSDTDVKTPPPSRRRVPKRMTLREFEAFDTNPDEKWELIDGVPFMTPSARLPHNELLDALKFFLLQHLKPIGAWTVARDTSVRIPKFTSELRPDLAAYLRTDLVSPKVFPIKARPKLVVECVSPGSEDFDFKAKKQIYQKSGVPEYWIVDPKTGAITLLVLAKSGYEQLSYDPKGRILSPLIGRSLRIVVEEWDFRIEA